ncbi:MAG: acyl-CoA/acyl-ACP dehydrogenase, partial [Acidimicrobiia bacterium]|nr:acyl-CoA/acyl-ACP dehydrogenase [Acidimicrobiia bacterium]
PAAAHWTGAPGDSPWIIAARDLVPELADRAAALDASGEFAHDNYDLLRSRRFPSMLVPAELGGGGGSFAETCAVLAELARGCPATSLALSMHQHLVAAQVWRHHRDLPAPVLPKVAAGELILVSTGAADWMASNGRATKVDGGWRVSARKSPSSGAPAGDILVTSIRWDPTSNDDAPAGPQVLHLSVPFTAEGVSVEPTWNTMGMRATGSDTVVLDDVLVLEAAVALARPADRWHPVWASVLGVALPLIMASYVGVAEAAADGALALARTKAGRVHIPGLAGRVGNRLTAARDTVRAMVDAADDLRFGNTLAVASASLTRKTLATQAVTDVARLALELGGGAAYQRTSDIERLFRDAHAALYHPLPEAEQEVFSGRLALGLDPITGERLG